MPSAAGLGVMMTAGDGDRWAASAAIGRAGLTGVVEVFAAKVDPTAGDVAASLPDLDRLDGDAELGGDLLEREHACGSEPLVVRRDAAVLAELGQRDNGEWVTPTAGQALAVEDLDRLVIGVIVEQLIDQRDRAGGRGVRPPHARSGRGTCSVCCWPPERRTCAAICPPVLCSVTSVTRRRISRFRSRIGVAGLAHSAGRSVASARILACCSSVSGRLPAWVARSYSSRASTSSRSLLFQSASSWSATSRLVGSTAR